MMLVLTGARKKGKEGTVPFPLVAFPRSMPELRSSFLQSELAPLPTTLPLAPPQSLLAAGLTPSPSTFNLSTPLRHSFTYSHNLTMTLIHYKYDTDIRNLHPTQIKIPTSGNSHTGLQEIELFNQRGHNEKGVECQSLEAT